MSNQNIINKHQEKIKKVQEDSRDALRKVLSLNNIELIGDDEYSLSMGEGQWHLYKVK